METNKETNSVTPVSIDDLLMRTDRSDDDYMTVVRRMEVERQELVRVLDSAQHLADSADYLKKRVIYGNGMEGMPLPGINECALTVRRAQLLHAILGVVSEAGEMIEAFRRTYDETNEAVRVNCIEEGGDVIWYITRWLKTSDSSVQDASQRVYRKLQTRYPEKFTEAAALNRDLNAEFGALTGGPVVKQSL